MKFPSKVTTYKESSLALFPLILEHLEKTPMTPGQLYKKVKGKTKGLSEYLEILDCLYALQKIDIVEGVLWYAD